MNSGILHSRVNQALELMRNCRLCPRACGCNRLEGELGACRTGRSASVASFGPHFGEESPLVGRCGSGTVFFCGCNLGCTFCQNWDISQGTGGAEVTAESLAGIFCSVQDSGCHNLNLVTPTHVMPQILEALDLAVSDGLQIPLVWNCGGYECVESLKLLDGIVDIYMPDLKFTTPEPAKRFCDAPDYPQRAKDAIKEMHRQVGDLEINDEGIAVRGLLVRHLIMPDDLAGSDEAIRFLSQEISPNTYVNIMNQYHPCHLANNDSLIDHRPNKNLWRNAQKAATLAGLRLDK